MREMSVEKTLERLDGKLPQLSEVSLAYIEGRVDAFLLGLKPQENKKSAS